MISRNPWARMPLATKVLVGLGLNIVLLIVGFTVVFAAQTRINPTGLIAGRTGERLQSVAELILGDLGPASPETAENIIDRYSEAYRMDFRLFDITGRHVAGSDDPLPVEVTQWITRQRGPFGGRAARFNPQDPVVRPDGTPRRGPRNPRRFADQEPFPRIVRRGGTPPAYWVVIQLPPVGQFHPLCLVVRSESLWAGALLLDLKPWLLAVAGAFALSGIFWFPLIRGITRDISRMMRGTEEIAAGRFDSRVSLERTDELGRLAEAIDQMAERLSGFVAGQKRFLGDAAHELCSPLARMRTAMAVLEGQETGKAQPYIADIREELDEMAALVNELLAFSRASHGRTVHREPTPIRQIVERAWNREGRDTPALETDIVDSLTADADPGLLQRAVANLFRNAVRYAGKNSPIRAQAVRDGESVVLTITDEGPGVPSDALPRLFEPFFRPEPSRSRELGGVGLGLAIVKTCVDACDGTVSARNRTPRGFEVTLRLKAASEPRGTAQIREVLAPDESAPAAESPPPRSQDHRR